MNTGFRQLAVKVGILRLLLALFTIILIIAAWFAGSESHYHDWRFYPTVLAPAMVPILIFVYPLDMTMSAVIMSGAEPEEKQRHRFILRFDAILLAVLLLAWLSFFLRLLSQT